jgi:hypothetical protein
MCRSIKQLRGPEAVADDDIAAAALQFVRKISGQRKPTARNEAAFQAAVEAITATSRQMLDEMGPTRARPAPLPDA